MSKRPVISIRSAAGVLLFIVVNAHASEAEAPPTTLEEVIVTAQKRAENLQTTPISVTALTSQTLTQRSQNNIVEALNFIPNVDISVGAGNSNSPGLTSVFIRGIGQSDFIITSDPGVGMYVDGVYLARSTGAALDLSDVERIEVLRGPQGTLFGKNTIGGAVNIVTRAPSDVLTGSFQADGGSKGWAQGRAFLSGPVTSDVAVKGSLAYKRRDGYGTLFDFGTNQDRGTTGGISDLIGRFGVRAKLADQVQLDASFDFTRNRDQSVPDKVFVNNPSAAVLSLWNALVGLPSGMPLTPAIETVGRYDSYATGPNFSDQDIRGGNVTLQWNPGALTVKSISALRTLQSSVGRDGDGSPADYLGSTYKLDERQVSEELQLLGDTANSQLHWLTGFYYLHETGHEITNGWVARGLFSALEALPTSLDHLAPGPGFDPTAPVTPGVPGGFGNPVNEALNVDLRIDNRQTTDSYAWFGQASYTLTPKLSATAGLRFTHESKDFITIGLTRAISDVNVVPPNTVQRGSWNSVSPRVAVEFRPSDSLMLYASAANGFKSGGFNGRALDFTSFTAFSPEKVWTLETGLKSQWLDQRLRFNTAVFFNDYRDIQTQIVRATAQGATAVYTANAARAHSYGLESELAFRPVSQLEVGAGIGYIHARYTQLDSGSSLTLNSRFPQTPELTFNASAQYTASLSQRLSMVLRGDYSYRSKVYNDTANSELIAQSGFGLLNARLALRSSDGWEVALFGTNLTDKNYITTGLDGSNAIGIYDVEKGGPPRLYGVSLRYDF